MLSFILSVLYRKLFEREWKVWKKNGTAGLKRYNEFGDGKTQVKTDSECPVINITVIKNQIVVKVCRLLHSIW